MIGHFHVIWQCEPVQNLLFIVDITVVINVFTWKYQFLLWNMQKPQLLSFFLKLPFRKYVSPGSLRYPNFLAINLSVVLTMTIPYSDASSSINSMCRKIRLASGSSGSSSCFKQIKYDINVRWVSDDHLISVHTYKIQQPGNLSNQCIRTMCHDRFPQYFRRPFAQASNLKRPFHSPNFLENPIKTLIYAHSLMEY